MAKKEVVMDLFLHRLAGLWLLIQGIVGACWTILYDFTVSRSFSLGINAIIALGFFVMSIVLGIVLIKEWWQ